MPYPGTDDPNRPVYSGGPCPGCDRRGVLLILRREDDGALLFHCPTCGLSFTHVSPGEEPEYARSLRTLAPAGAGPATEGEIRGSGLWHHALPWKGGAHGHEPEPRPAPQPAPKPSPPKSKTASAAISVGAILLVIKLLVLLARLFD